MADGRRLSLNVAEAEEATKKAHARKLSDKTLTAFKAGEHEQLLDSANKEGRAPSPRPSVTSPRGVQAEKDEKAEKPERRISRHLSFTIGIGGSSGAEKREDEKPLLSEQDKATDADAGATQSLLDSPRGMK